LTSVALAKEVFDLRSFSEGGLINARCILLTGLQK
jgi:hypothetical protein